MSAVSRRSLLEAGFQRSGDFYSKGKVSVYQCEDDGEYYLNHEFPFDFLLTGMEQIRAIDTLFQDELIHISEPTAVH